MDYYLEDGFVVFTKEFHLKRGYCCNNGCKNCPYKNDDILEDVLYVYVRCIHTKGYLEGIKEQLDNYLIYNTID